MQNYMVLEEKKLQTPYGIFGGVDTFTCHASGEIAGIRLSEKNMIVTEVGELVPAYTETNRRKNKPAVEFDRHGMVVSVALESRQEIKTPIGELPVELVKFYPTGELHRVFILDGQISGFWTEEDERALNIPLTFDLKFAKFRTMINGLCFYKSGDIRSITLYPGEQISLTSPSGIMKTKIGLSLYESGKLKSVEPSEPIMVSTPVGNLSAYDPEQIGVNADRNSLSFTEDGRILTMITCDHSVYVQTEEGVLKKISPTIKPHPLYDDVLTVSGMMLKFDYDKNQVTIHNHTFSLENCGFTIEPFQRPGMHCNPSNCANCSLCNKRKDE